MNRLPDLPLLPTNATLSDRYTRFVKPGLGRLMHSFGLDVSYHRAEGDFLWYFDRQDRETKVLDLVGSYGATLMGHNHPALTAHLQNVLQRNPPHLVQASVRSAATRLAQRLHEEARTRLQNDYCASFFNSGAEAVEAAIKHLLLLRRHRLERESEAELLRVRNILHRGVSLTTLNRTTCPDPQFPDSAFTDPMTFLVELQRSHARQIANTPTILALEHAYHGLTLGALGLTFNQKYRLPFAEQLLPVQFIPPDPDAFRSAADQHRCRFLSLEEHSGNLTFHEVFSPNVLGLFLEPVLGEGGVLPLLPETISALAKVARQEKILVVADEIQSGMGRTGTLFAWERSKHRGPDFLLLSKFLGGGLAKISAVLSQRDQTDSEFGIIHASTFAEDELSAEVAIRVLELVTDNHDALLQEVVLAGQEWRKRLSLLVRDYPDIIREVRGQGLLLGVEFHDLENSGSNLLRFICAQGDFGYFIAGFLLHEFGIRIAPALNSKNTVRIEPSVYCPAEAMDRTIAAFRRLCEALRLRDTGALSRHLLEEPAEPEPIRLYDFQRAPSDYLQPEPRVPERVAFLGHFIDPTFLGRHEPALARFSPDQLQKLIHRTWEWTDPCLFVSRDLTSRTGAKVNFNFIGLSITSEILVEHLRRHDLEPVRVLIRKAMETARDQGCRLVGFGQFTSIVTRNCLEVVLPPVACTSGNSLTVGVALRALERATSRRGVPITALPVAILGAGGNIGSTYARLLADQAESLTLIGGTGRDSQKRLRRTLALILQDQARNLATGTRIGPIAEKLRELPAFKLHQSDFSEITLDDSSYEILLGKLGDAFIEEGPIRLGQISSCRSCKAIVTATNTAEPIVFPAHVSPGTIICDISIPSAVSREVASVPGVEVFKGGVVALPNHELLNIGALPLEPGLVYACMAETILLGLERHWQDFSVGDISRDQVYQALAMADKHGFTLARLKGEDSL